MQRTASVRAVIMPLGFAAPRPMTSPLSAIEPWGHVRTQFRPNPGDVFVWVSTQMGVDGRIEEQ